jgi:hypothetical protein
LKLFFQSAVKEEEKKIIFEIEKKKRGGSLPSVLFEA